jgi:O-antigen/teichoic acid export membrane protein
MSWVLADQCVVSAANFLTIFLFARHFHASDFGAFMLAYTGLLLLTSMQSALLIQPHHVLAAPLPQDEYRRFTGSLAIMQACACAIVCATLAVAGWFVARGSSQAAGGILVALALAGAPWLAQEFVRRVLYTRRDARGAACNDAITYGTQLAGAIVLVWGWPQFARPEAALAVLGASSALGAFMGLWQLRRHVEFGRGSLTRFAQTSRDVWRFSKWLVGQNALVWLGVQGHTWVVGLVLGSEQVGYYRAITHLTSVMNIVRQAAVSHLPTHGSLAHHSGGVYGLSLWVTRTWWMLLAALLPFCVVLAGFPGWALSLAYGERYAGTQLALILALSTIAQCALFSKFPFDIGLLALRESKSLFYVQFIPVVLLWTSGLGLVWWLGILGVALSSLVINAVLLCATWRSYARIARRHRSVGDSFIDTRR